MRAPLLVPAVALTLVLSGCAAESSGGGSGPTASAGASGPAPASSSVPDCSATTLRTHTGGRFTVATDSPAYEPWFVDNKPANGKGYESAVAFAVAKQLGFGANQVTWVKVPFNSVIAPTPKAFDVDVNQVSITPQRAAVVDFSTGYYDVAQAVVAFKNNRFAKATSLAGLANARLGAQKGTTSYDAIGSVLKPSRTPREYPTNDLAVQALKNGQIDGLVVDLPTGLYLTAAELDDSTIVGQLPVRGKPEQFGMVLDHNSPLTTCVSRAVDALRANGTLAALQKKWLTTTAGAPELK